MANIEDIVIEEQAYDWLDFPFWVEAISYGHKFHSFVAWLADTDAYLCAVVINRKAEFLSMLARIRAEMTTLEEMEKAACNSAVEPPCGGVLPEDWIKIVDPSSNAPYFYNMVSGKSQWTFPGIEAEVPVASPRSVAAPRQCIANARAPAKRAVVQKPQFRDPMAKDPRRKAPRAPAVGVEAPEDLLRCPSSLLSKHQGAHVHRY